MSLSSYCTPKTSTELLALGPQPISNRFVDSAADAQERLPITISQCRESGIIYLSKSMPQEKLVPQIDWLTYNEPEDHLDRMVEEISEVCRPAPGDIIGAVSSKDDTTLTRFESLGFKTWRLSLDEDLGIKHRGVGVESIQRELSRETGSRAANTHGRAKILIVRHIFEHVYNIPRFIEGLRAMVAPGGYIVFEVPDCTRALDRCDYTTIWEEHLYYFTPQTLKLILELSGFGIEFFKVYHYPFEDSLVAVVKDHMTATEPKLLPAELETELKRGANFSSHFSGRKITYQDILKSYRARGELALFGAGHLSSTFLSLFEIDKLFSFVIDDNPHKLGKVLPGTSLPVKPSSSLEHEKLALCLLGLNPMNEDKVVAKFSPWITALGGEIKSIFPASKRFLAQGAV